MTIILDILSEIYIISLSIAPYLFFGFFIAGIIKAFIQDNFIEKHLGKNSFFSVLKSALFGIPLPLCSCSVIPIAYSLDKKGASKGAVTSFLISTPETGVDSIMVTYGVLGWVYAVFRPIAAFVNSIIAGIFVNLFTVNKDKIEAENQINQPIFSHLNDLSFESNKKESLITKLKKGITYAFSDLYPDIAKTLLIGILLSGILSYFIPDNYLTISSQYPLISMLIVLVISVPVYICATASTPIAASLILKGLNPGAALVYLLAGPATNTVTITTVKKLLGLKGLIIYLLSIILTSLFAGWVFNQIITSWSVPVLGSSHQHNNWIEHISAIILILSLFWFNFKSVLIKNKKI